MSKTKPSMTEVDDYFNSLENCKLSGRQRIDYELEIEFLNKTYRVYRLCLIELVRQIIKKTYERTNIIKAIANMTVKELIAICDSFGLPESSFRKIFVELSDEEYDSLKTGSSYYYIQKEYDMLFGKLAMELWCKSVFKSNEYNKWQVPFGFVRQQTYPTKGDKLNDKVISDLYEINATSNNIFDAFVRFDFKELNTDKEIHASEIIKILFDNDVPVDTIEFNYGIAFCTCERCAQDTIVKLPNRVYNFIKKYFYYLNVIN